MNSIRPFLKKKLSTSPKLLLKVSPDQYLKETKWILKVKRNYQVVHFLLPSYPLHLFLASYASDIQDIILKNPSAFSLIKKNWLAFFASCSDDDKLFLCKLFYLSKIFDDEVSCTIMSFAKNTPNPEIRYWAAMDISQMTFASQKGVYDNFYLDRRNLLKQIAVENKLDFKRQESTSKKEKKVCIITYLLADNTFNSMQRVAMMVAKGMAQYAHVDVLSLESFHESCFYRQKNRTLFASTKPERNRKKIRRLFGKSIPVYFSKGSTPAKRMRSSLQILSKLNPDVIIDISDEYSPSSYEYSRNIPTYYIPMRNYASSSYFTKALGRPWKYQIVNEQYHSISEEQVADWSFPEYVPPKAKAFTKQDLGLKEDSFVIVTAGNNWVCESALVDEMVALVTKHDNFIWLFVGGAAPVYLQEKYKDLLTKRKIIEWGFEKNLSGLFSACDVLLRANTTGGSGATAIGAQQGLPIVMTDFVCDPMRWLGQDYSSFKTYHDLTVDIEKLASDKMYYQIRSKITKEKADEATNAEKQWLALSKIIGINQ